MCDNSICRICLSFNDLEPIFNNSNINEERCNELFLVTGIKIEPYDGLTQQICKQCNEIIKSSLKLRLQCVQSEKILLQRRSELKNKTTQECKKLYKGNKKIISEIVTKKLEYNVANEDSLDNDDSLIHHEVEWNRNERHNVETKKVKRQRLSKEQQEKYMSLAIITDKHGPVRCKLCYTELREKRFFINHAKTHFEAEHTCEFCGKKFVNRNSMRYHQQRMHGALKKLACSLCPYRAVDSSQLLNHKRAVHTGCRPYTCHVCGDTFRLRAAVAQHLRKHFATYNVQCERCPAIFRSRSELAGHRNKVHLMCYTYSCYLCSGKYKAANTVKKHLVKAHGVPKEQHLPIKCVKKRREITPSKHWIGIYYNDILKPLTTEMN